jgi:hypothetical protein
MAASFVLANCIAIWSFFGLICGALMTLNLQTRRALKKMHQHIVAHS